LDKIQLNKKIQFKTQWRK